MIDSLDSRPSARTTFWASLALWGFWLVSALPLLVLFLEFRCGELGECGAEWWYYASFYSSLFLYPVTFGFFSTAFLHRPWIRTVHYLLSLPEPTRTRMIGLLVVAIGLVVSLVCLAEFHIGHPSSHSAFKGCPNPTKFTGSTPAPWSIAPGVMEAEDADMIVRSLLEKRCKSVSQSLNDSEKCEFQEKLSVLWKDRNRSESYTEQSYRWGTAALTTLFALLFVTIFIAGTSKSMKSPAGERNSEDEQMKTLLKFALLFATLWVLMRVPVMWEKLSVYPGDPLFYVYMAIILFFVFVNVWFYFMWAKPEHVGAKRKRWIRLLYLYGHFVCTVLTIATTTGVVGVWEPNWALIPEVLVEIFGTGGSPLHYLFLIVFLLLVYLPYRLRYMREDGKSDDVGGPGAT